jgi:subtilisin-like proprotein convertase family protein
MFRSAKLVAISLTATLAMFAASAHGAVIPFSFAGPPEFNVDTDPGTEVQLSATLAGTILDLNVSVSITNPDAGGHMEDLDLLLTSPDGTTVQFRNNFVDHQDEPLAATFDDEAVADHEDQGNPPVGTFRPFSPLSAFDGEELMGTWTLTILDTEVPGDNDDLLGWSISGTVETSAIALPEPATGALLAIALAGLISVRRRRCSSCPKMR